MVFLYIYLSGIVAVMLLWIFIKWFRPETKSDVANCLFSWIMVAIVIWVYIDNWKLIRKVRKLSDEELLKEENNEPDIEFPGGQIKEG